MNAPATWTPVAAPSLRHHRPGTDQPEGDPGPNGVSGPDGGAGPAAPPGWRTFRSRVGDHVLVLEGSQVLDLPAGSAAGLGAATLAPYLAHGASLHLGAVPSVAPQSISLNLTSACNLACSYCYADGGGFEGAQRGAMTAEVAEAAVDRLLASCDRRARATIGFLGGEPFLQGALLAHVVDYATRRAARLGQPLVFSVTTNGTRLREVDLELLRTHPFAVTVSIDGDRAVHDRNRPALRGGGSGRGLLPTGSWDAALARVRPLLADPGLAAVSARATVTAEDVDLARRHDALVAEGFTVVGFSPVRTGSGAFTDDTWPRWLAAAVELGERCLADVLAGRPCAFDNLAVALRQIDAGASSPYPCGAGGGYFSVATDGEWFACHRAVGDGRFARDDGRGGIDAARQQRFLLDHHVERVEPCRRCWARYLCSGGCHHEADTRTDAACEAVRGWLEFCLDAYCAVSAQRPEWFGVDPSVRRGHAGGGPMTSRVESC